MSQRIDVGPCKNEEPDQIFAFTPFGCQMETRVTIIINARIDDSFHAKFLDKLPDGIDVASVAISDQESFIQDLLKKYSNQLKKDEKNIDKKVLMVPSWK